MKTLVTLTLLTLICVLHHSSAAPAAVGIVVGGEECCKNHTQLLIPKQRVKHMAMTPGRCASKAIVITSVCNVKFCIDPNWTWAKNLLKEFQSSTANKMPPSAPFNLSKCENGSKKA